MTTLKAVDFYDQSLTQDDNIKAIKALDSIQRRALILSLIEDLKEEVEMYLEEGDVEQAFMTFQSVQSIDELIDSAVERAVLLGMIDLVGPEL
jgi:hypothetical protein